jgi:hypothetical protein
MVAWNTRVHGVVVSELLERKLALAPVFEPSDTE